MDAGNLADAVDDFLEVFQDADYIVVPSGSCTSMIAHHFEDIFDKEPGSLKRARIC